MTRAAIFAPVLLLAFACGGDEDTGRQGHTGEGGHEHSGTGEHDHYADGMVKSSETGAYRVSLTSEPGPPAVGTNTLTLGITDADGGLVEGASVTVTPFMPAHEHGSSGKPVVTEDGMGVYTATGVVLQMLGVWELRIGISHEGVEDDAVFTFDVK